MDAIALRRGWSRQAVSAGAGQWIRASVAWLGCFFCRWGSLVLLCRPWEPVQRGREGSERRAVGPAEQVWGRCMLATPGRWAGGRRKAARARTVALAREVEDGRASWHASRSLLGRSCNCYCQKNKRQSHICLQKPTYL